MSVRWTTVAAGIGAVIVVVAVVVVLRGRGNVETIVILDDNAQGDCVVIQKDPVVTVKKDKKLTWIVENGCTNTSELVTVGNFRTAESGSATHCRTGIEGTGVSWPFKEDPDDLQKRQGTRKIELHTKKSDELEGDRLTYYYDICTGTNADRKSDPRLVIEE